MALNRWKRWVERQRCRAAHRVLQSYVDGELGSDQALEVADHINRCVDCCMEAASYRLLQDALARLREDIDQARLARLARTLEVLIANEA